MAAPDAGGGPKQPTTKPGSSGSGSSGGFRGGGGSTSGGGAGRSTGTSSSSSGGGGTSSGGSTSSGGGTSGGGTSSGGVGISTSRGGGAGRSTARGYLNSIKGGTSAPQTSSSSTGSTGRLTTSSRNNYGGVQGGGGLARRGSSNVASISTPFFAAGLGDGASENTERQGQGSSRNSLLERAIVLGMQKTINDLLSGDITLQGIGVTSENQAFDPNSITDMQQLNEYARSYFSEKLPPRSNVDMPIMRIFEPRDAIVPGNKQPGRFDRLKPQEASNNLTAVDPSFGYSDGSIFTRTFLSPTIDDLQQEMYQRGIDLSADNRGGPPRDWAGYQEVSQKLNEYKGLERGLMNDARHREDSAIADLYRQYGDLGLQYGAGPEFPRGPVREEREEVRNQIVEKENAQARKFIEEAIQRYVTDPGAALIAENEALFGDSRLTREINNASPNEKFLSWPHFVSEVVPQNQLNLYYHAHALYDDQAADSLLNNYIIPQAFDASVEFGANYFRNDPSAWDLIALGMGSVVQDTGYALEYGNSLHDPSPSWSNAVIKAIENDLTPGQRALITSGQTAIETLEMSSLAGAVPNLMRTHYQNRADGMNPNDAANQAFGKVATDIAIGQLIGAGIDSKSGELAANWAEAFIRENYKQQLENDAEYDPVIMYDLMRDSEYYK